MAFLFRAVTLCALSATAQPTFLSASSPLVLWSGRSSRNATDGSVAFDWESAACSFSVQGIGSSVTMYTNVTLAGSTAGKVSVYINDYDSSNMLITAGTGSYLIAAALAFQVNNITVVYGMEPGVGGANRLAGMTPAIFGFEATGGGSFVPPVQLTRRVDIIGDSISAGAMYDKLEAVNGPLSLNTGCHPWAPVVGYSQTFTWEAYLCRAFRANCTTVAWSGKGLIHNSGCHAGPLMPQLYNQTFGTSDVEMWDFSTQARPDAVIIYLGTNDFSCNLTTDADFTAAYVKFMTTITAQYAASPGTAAPIRFFATIGLMSPTSPLAALEAAIAQGNSAGLSVTLLDMRNATTDGCGGHPGPAGHWEMAQQAKPQIQSVMGW